MHNNAASLAVILAAGKGNRLGDDVTGGTPKCLLDIAGKNILTRQVEAVVASGVRRFAMVVGYEQDQIRRACAELADKHDLSFTFIENPRYAETNTIYSLYLVAPLLTETFLYFNADVVFPNSVVQMLQDSPHGNALAVEEKACGEEEVKVIVEDGRIRRIAKTIEPTLCLGEFIGVAKFGGDTAPQFVQSLTYACETENKVATFFEYALDRIAADVDLMPVSTGDAPVIEIDFPEDLKRAREVVAPTIDRIQT